MEKESRLTRLINARTFFQFCGWLFVIFGLESAVSAVIEGRLLRAASGLSFAFAMLLWLVRGIPIPGVRIERTDLRGKPVRDP